jgi:hypothetical protein
MHLDIYGRLYYDLNYFLLTHNGIVHASLMACDLQCHTQSMLGLPYDLLWPT